MTEREEGVGGLEELAQATRLPCRARDGTRVVDACRLKRRWDVDHSFCGRLVLGPLANSSSLAAGSSRWTGTADNKRMQLTKSPPRFSATGRYRRRLRN